MTSVPHMAGTPGDKQSADYIYDQWKTHINLDSVQMTEYDVLLDFPDDVKFNRLLFFFLIKNLFHFL